MKKLLQQLSNIKLLLFLLLFCCTTTIFSQNIRVKVNLDRILLYGLNGALDWNDELGTSGTDLRLRLRMKINGIDYDYSYDIDEYYGTFDITPWKGINYLWYQSPALGIPENSTISILLDAWEDDLINDDASCGGYQTILPLNTINQKFNYCIDTYKDSIACSSDGTIRDWGFSATVRWQWVALQEDAIDNAKVVCADADHVNVYAQSFGTLDNVAYQWQKSTDATNWTNIPGNETYAAVDLTTYNTPMFLYVRKVKKGVTCSGFSTPADENSNICIIQIKANPTTLPTATKLPNLSGVCSATIENPLDQYNGTIPFLWEYQTSYDGGFSWSPIQNTIPTLTNSTTSNITAKIRFRANYYTSTGCADSPWREYSWLLYPQPVVSTASVVYPATTNYSCSLDSMYVIFNNDGYGAGYDEYQYTTNGGTTWLAYTNGQKINTSIGGTSYGIRARRKTSDYDCFNTAYVYYGYWTPYKAASSPNLLVKTPNVGRICTPTQTSVSATITSGSFGMPGQATNQYQFSTDGGNTWQTYTSGAAISTLNATVAIIIRVRRLDGNPTTGSNGPCSTDWSEIAKWDVVDPFVNFTATSSLCYSASTNYIEFIATNPSPATGTWSIISGSGTLSSTTSLTPSLTGVTIGMPTTVRWSTTRLGCTVNKDTIITPLAGIVTSLTKGGTCQTCPIRNGNTIRFFDPANRRLMIQIEDLITPTTDLKYTEVCVDADVAVQSVITNYGVSQPYLQRHYSIKPTTNTTSNVTLYFTKLEFDSLRNKCVGTPYAFTNVNELIVSKYPNGGNNIYTLPNTSGGTYVLPTASGLDANGYYYLTIPISTYSTFYIHSYDVSPSVLPVELTYFTTTCEADKVKIEWQTASEYNNHHFEIERSENAIDFKTIFSIPSQNGNSNQIQNYLVYDNHFNNEELYYRLKQIDNDEQFSYSKITTTDCNNLIEKNMVIKVFPNPTTDVLTIAINNFENGKAKINIYDFSSNLILQKEIQLINGNNFYNVSLNNLTVGMYLIEIINNDKTIFRNKIVKQ